MWVGAAGLEVAVCGEMASQPLMAFALIGLGVRQLSVAPRAVPLVKRIVRGISVQLADGGGRARRSQRDNAAGAERQLARAAARRVRRRVVSAATGCSSASGPDIVHPLRAGAETLGAIFTFIPTRETSACTIVICSPRSPSPRGIRTRSPTRSRTPSSTPSSPTIPTARVACETLVTTGLACVAGEITTTTYVDIPKLVRSTIERIGYTDATFGFDNKTCAVISTIDKQSPDIAQGVDTGGAGDQGMMFGYATDETDELMPMPILLAHRLTRALADRRQRVDSSGCGPTARRR